MDRYWLDGGVIMYITLHHALVIPAPYTAFLQYLIRHLESVKDYPVYFRNA
jgi:hypothetical protein